MTCVINLTFPISTAQNFTRIHLSVTLDTSITFYLASKSSVGANTSGIKWTVCITLQSRRRVNESGDYQNRRLSEGRSDRLPRVDKSDRQDQQPIHQGPFERSRLREEDKTFERSRARHVLNDERHFLQSWSIFHKKPNKRLKPIAPGLGKTPHGHQRKDRRTLWPRGFPRIQCISFERRGRQEYRRDILSQIWADSVEIRSRSTESERIRREDRRLRTKFSSVKARSVRSRNIASHCINLRNNWAPKSRVALTVMTPVHYKKKASTAQRGYWAFLQWNASWKPLAYAGHDYPFGLLRHPLVVSSHVSYSYSTATTQYVIKSLGCPSYVRKVCIEIRVYYKRYPTVERIDIVLSPPGTTKLWDENKTVSFFLIQPRVRQQKTNRTQNFLHLHNKSPIHDNTSLGALQKDADRC